MSKGHWDFRNKEIGLDFPYAIDKIQIILPVVDEALDFVDGALSMTYDEQYVKDELYKLFVKLGNVLYGEE